MSDDMLRRLQADDARLRQTETKETPLDSSGSAFPASPATGRVFFRTDLGWWCYYDGTRWLTVHEDGLALQPLTTYAVTGGGPVVALRTDYAPYITRVAVTTAVTAPNTGAAFWTVDLIGLDLPITGITSAYAFTTAADAAGVRVLHEAAPSTPNPTNRQFLRIRFVTTGAPGALEVTATAYARLIVP